jgi:electron transfer flavoprotein alpha/beta subunit
LSRIAAVLEVTADPRVLRYDLLGEALEDVLPIISRQDAGVLEWGKRLAKERNGELNLIVVGKEGDEGLLSRLSLVGVARVFFLISPHPAVEQPKERVSQLASLLRELSPDIVLCSERQSDGFHSFTGGWLAELLQFSHLGGVEAVHSGPSRPQVLARTAFKKGYKGTYRIELPAVLSIRTQEVVAYVPQLSRVHLQSRQVPLEAVAVEPAAGGEGRKKTIAFQRLSEVKPRTKTTARPTVAAATGSGPARGNPLAARMKMMMGARQAEAAEQKAKQIVTDSADKAARLLLAKLEEWRKEM